MSSFLPFFHGFQNKILKNKRVFITASMAAFLLVTTIIIGVLSVDDEKHVFAFSSKQDPLRGRM